MKRYLLAAATFAALSAFAAPGDLATAFGNGGSVDLAIGPSSDHLVKVLVQADGKSLAIGNVWLGGPQNVSADSSVALGLARYNTNGTADSTFGSGGKLRYRDRFDTEAVDALIQPDGKVLVAARCGGRPAGNAYPCMFRFNADGTRDTSFVADLQALPDSRFELQVIALQPDGKILGALSAQSPTALGFGVFRLTAAGAFDTAFGAQGVARTPDARNVAAQSIAVQTDGAVVVAGQDRSLSAFYAIRFASTGAYDAAYHPLITGLYDVKTGAMQPDNALLVGGCVPTSPGGPMRLTIARVLAGGTLDPAFGNGGVAQPASLPNLCAKAIAPRGDGRVLIAASNTDTSVFHAVQLAANGTLDATFGGGDVAFSVGGTLDEARAVALQADGKALVAGDSNARDFAVARLGTTGAPDTGFAGTGATVTDFAAGRPGRLVELRVRNGKTVALAHLPETDARVAGLGEVALARFTPAGLPDATFGTAGKVLASLSTSLPAGQVDAAAQSLAVQADDKVLVAGLGRVGGNLSAVVMRFNADGSVDATFGASGRKVLFTALDGLASVQRIEVLGDGRILASGRITTPPATGCCTNTHDPYVVRLGSDGSFDASFGVAGMAHFAEATAIAGSFLSDTLNSRLSLAPLASGGLLLAGSDPATFSVTRLLLNGAIDTSFGVNGVYLPRLNGNPQFGVTRSVVVQGDGRVAVAGWTDSAVTFCGNHSILQIPAFSRSNGDGTLDATTVAGGQLYGGLYTGFAGLWSARLGADDRIAIAGFGPTGCVPEGTGDLPGDHMRGRAMVARFTPAGALDMSFGARGVVELGDNIVTSNYARDVAFLDAGTIVAATERSRVGVPFTLYWLEGGGAATPAAIPGDIDGDGRADAQDLGLTDPFVPDNPATNTVLSLTVSGSGFVRVWPTFSGCYQPDTTCPMVVRLGAPVVLTPWALPGWLFAGWLGADCPGLGTCTYTANGPASATALFVRDPGGSLSSSVIATPTALDFGLNTMHVTSAAQTVLVDNLTAGAVTVSSIGIDNAAFTQTNNCTVIAAGSNCRIGVTFTPTVSGAASATLSIATSGGNIAIPLAGSGNPSLAVHYYRSILGREPDAAGLAFWESEAARLAALGADPREVYYVMANFFFNSPEYLAANKTDGQFVTDLYETFFNRAPDAGGLAFWTGQITAGTPRYVVLLFFMFSPEFQSFSTGIFGNAQARPEVNMVMDFFRGFLNRLPDTTAFNFWVGQLRTAQCQGPNAVYNAVNAVSLLFLSSAEYTGRARDNTQFVTDLYNAFLRRGGEASGVQFWVNQLNQGLQDRNAERVQFIVSPEFAARVNAVVTAGCLP